MFEYQHYGSAFFDMRLHKLRVLITEQMDRALLERDISPPSSAISVMLYLADIPHASIARIADALGYSHQLIAHRLKQLEKLGLIVRFVDASDRRKSLIELTPKGRVEAEKINALMPDIAKAFDDIFERLGTNLSNRIDDVRSELITLPLHDRLSAETSPGEISSHAPPQIRRTS